MAKILVVDDDQGMREFLEIKESCFSICLLLREEHVYE